MSKLKMLKEFQRLSGELLTEATDVEMLQIASTIIQNISSGQIKPKVDIDFMKREGDDNFLYEITVADYDERDGEFMLVYKADINLLDDTHAVGDGDEEDSKKADLQNGYFCIVDPDLDAETPHVKLTKEQSSELEMILDKKGIDIMDIVHDKLGQDAIERYYYD